MTTPDPREDPEGIALVEGTLARTGYQPVHPAVKFPACPVELDRLAEAFAAMGVVMQSWQESMLRGVLGAQKLVEALQAAGLVDEVPPEGLRERALWAKQHAGKGPPSSVSWRGRERATKFRSQS